MAVHKTHIGDAVASAHLIRKAVIARGLVAIGDNRDGAVVTHHNLGTVRPQHMRPRVNRHAVDGGDEQPGPGHGGVVAQQVQRGLAVMADVKAVIGGHNFGLHGMGGDQQVAVTDRVAAIRDADADVVDDAGPDMHFQRQGDGQAVHLGVQGTAGIVDIQARTGPCVDVVDRHIATTHRQLRPFTVDPNPHGVSIAKARISHVFSRQKRDLHGQPRPQGDKSRRKDRGVTGRGMGNFVQPGVDAAAVMECTRTVVGGTACVGEIAGPTG